MNDDLLKQNLPGENEAEDSVQDAAEEKAATENAQDEPAEADALNDELEALRETFQEKYDETVEEANAQPVIQELEEGEEKEEEEEEKEDSSETAEKSSKKKKKKPVKTAIITLVSLFVVFFVGTLLAYTVITVKEPDFAEFLNAYSNASAAESYEDKISYYESALSLAKEENTVISFFADSLAIREEAVVVTYDEQGFAAAYSYMKSNMSEEEIAAPKTPAFKKFAEAVAKVSEAGTQVFSKVFENTGDLKEVPEYSVLSEGLEFPAELEDDIGAILASVSSGYIFNKAATNLTDSITAVNYYGEAYSGLVSLGVDSRALAESIAVTLYDYGFVIEAATLISVALNPESEDASEEFTAVKTALDVYSSYDISVYDIALQAKEEGISDKAELTALVNEAAKMPAGDAKLITDLVAFALEAFTAEDNNNLTDAVSKYATLTSVLDALGMSDISVTVKTAEIMFAAGNLTEVQSLVQSYLTEEALADADEEEKAVVDNLNEVFDALTAVNEVFTPYYSSYYQSGTPIDYEALKAELDEKFGADATSYEKGFMNYVLYIAAAETEDVDTMSLISAMESYIPDLQFLYGYFYLDEYTRNGDYASARSYAEKLLGVNIADEFANGVIALCNRIDGDLDASIEAALKGIELSGSSSNCAKQLAVAYMLKGDFESAYGYVLSMYQNSMSVDSCDLILVLNHLYDGEDETIKAELEKLVAEVNQTYTYYSAESYADTKAILEGTKTLEDVFMGGNYELTAD